MPTEGVGWADGTPPEADNRFLVLFDPSDEVGETGDDGSVPAGLQEAPEEPVAWYGPIVMVRRSSWQAFRSSSRDVSEPDTRG